MDKVPREGGNAWVKCLVVEEFVGKVSRVGGMHG